MDWKRNVTVGVCTCAVIFRLSAEVLLAMHAPGCPAYGKEPVVCVAANPDVILPDDSGTHVSTSS